MVDGQSRFYTVELLQGICTGFQRIVKETIHSIKREKEENASKSATQMRDGDVAHTRDAEIPAQEIIDGQLEAS